MPHHHPIRTAFAALVVCCASAFAQAGASHDGLFSLPRSQDAIAELQAAREDLAAGRPAQAAQRLHRVITEFDFGVAPSRGAVDRWQGVRLAAVEQLRDLPDAGRTAYERIVDRESGALSDADPTTLSFDELLWLAERFPTSVAGRRARLRLADRAIASGAAIEAVGHLRAALDATAIGTPERAAIESRMSIASTVVDLSWGGGLQRLQARDGDSIATTVADALTGPATPAWPSYGGGYTNERQMRTPIGSTPSTVTFPIQADGFELNEFAMHAVGDLDGIYVLDGHAVHAIDPVAGTLAWRWDGPVIGTDDLFEARDWVNQQVPLVAAVSSELVVCALQVPNDIVGAAVQQRFRQAIPIINKLPSRRLFAIDRSNGKLVWSHWDGEGGGATERFSGHEASGAPVVHGDLVLCATHDPSGAIAFYLSAYDLHTGAPRWRKLICSSQQEVNMFGNARQEFAASGLAVEDGVVYGVTNLGVAFAADVDDGDVRWISGYETIPLPRTRLRDQESRPVYFANSPPLLVDGVLVAAPLDSQYVIGVDAESGLPLWQVRHDALRDVRIRWVLGTIDGDVILSGLGIAAVRARPREDGPSVRVLATPNTLGESYYSPSRIPRGAIVDDRIFYIASDGHVVVLDGEGRRVPATPPWSAPGNLLAVDGIAVQVKDGGVRVHTDLEGLGRATRLALRERPADPAVLLRLAKLEHALAGDDLEGTRGRNALEAYRLGLAAARDAGLGPGSRLHEQLARGLFRATFDRARAIATMRPDDGLALLVTARDGAPDARSWLRAQLAILDLVAGDDARSLAELERTAQRYGDLEYDFPGAGRVPVAVWSAWQSLDHRADPADRVRACQQLATRHGDVRYAGRAIRELAMDRIEALIDAHGRAVYAAVEAEAAERLEAAGDDRNALRQLTATFPHSESAARASARILDIAVAAGDFADALRSFAARLGEGDPSAGELRRTVAAAAQAGNLELAHALGARLAAQFGERASDFEPDRGARFAEVVAALPPAPRWQPRAPELPATVVAELRQPNLQTLLSFVPLEVPAGFPAPEHLPLLVARDEASLAVFPLTDGLPSSFDQHAFRVPIEDAGRRSSFHLCGDTLVVVQRDAARGHSMVDGRLLWSVPAGDADRAATSLGITGGVLHVFSELVPSAGDGGVLFGIEPVSGALLFRHVFPADRPSLPPVVSAGSLWTLDADAPDGPIFRCHDPVDFRVVQSTPIPDDAREALTLTERYSHRLRHVDIQTEFVADAQHVYLSANPSETGRPPRVAAIRRADGRTQWIWSGTVGMRLSKTLAMDGRVTVFERERMRARLVTLDARDRSELRSIAFDANAEAFGWPDERRDGQDGSLVVVDDPSGTRVTWIPLDPGAGRHFSQEFPDRGQIFPMPLRGDDFTLVTMRSRRNRSAEIYVMEPSSRREGALPGGRSTLTLDLDGSVKSFAHDGRVVLQSISGLHVLSAGRTDHERTTDTEPSRRRDR